MRPGVVLAAVLAIALVGVGVFALMPHRPELTGARCGEAQELPAGAVDAVAVQGTVVRSGSTTLGSLVRVGQVSGQDAAVFSTVVSGSPAECLLVAGRPARLGSAVVRLESVSPVSPLASLISRAGARARLSVAED